METTQLPVTWDLQVYPSPRDFPEACDPCAHPLPLIVRVEQLRRTLR